MKGMIFAVLGIIIVAVCGLTFAQESTQSAEYIVGVDDLLNIAVLQPDAITNNVTVAPDGFITFPYIGTVKVKGLTLSRIREEIQQQLANGYMKYPLVAVSLLESRSRKFFVYGEVTKSGAYALDTNTTVLKAISIAGGFTKFGSSSNVKILRPFQDKPGYELIKVNIKEVMDGKSDADILLQPGDTVVVSEGLF